VFTYPHLRVRAFPQKNKEDTLKRTL